MSSKSKSKSPSNPPAPSSPVSSRHSSTSTSRNRSLSKGKKSSSSSSSSTMSIPLPHPIGKSNMTKSPSSVSMMVSTTLPSSSPSSSVSPLPLSPSSSKPKSKKISPSILTFLSPSSLWAEYLNWLQRSPLLSKTWTAAILSIVSEIIAQYIVLSSSSASSFSIYNLNYTSILIQFILGFIWRGPSNHYWIEILNPLSSMLNRKYFHLSKIEDEGKSMKMIIMKVFIDCITFTLLSNYVYIWLLGILEMRSTEFIISSLRNNFWSIVFSSWKFWGVFNIIAFRFIPTDLLILAGNVVGIVWNVYLTLSTIQ